MSIFRIRSRRTLTATLGLAVLLLVSGTVLTKSIVPQIPTGIWATAGNGLNLSSPRAGAAAVQLQDGRILVTGGNDGSAAVASVDVFDTAGNYSPAAPMNVARTQHTATLLADGTVLVTGGVGTDGNATNSAEIYNPSKNSWTATGPLLTARSGHTANALPDGTVLLAGGDDSGKALSSLEIYSPETGTFSAVSGTLSSPREKHATAALPNGDVLIAGGWNGSAALATTDVYSFSSGTLAVGPQMSAARQGLSATAQLDGNVLIAGGNDGSQDLPSAEVYNASAGTFAATGSLVTARQGHLAFLLPHNGSILIVGGTTTVSGEETATSSAELYYPLANGTDASPNWNGTFNATGAMASPRVGATGSPMSNGTPTSVNDGILFAGGGKDSTGSPLATGELYGFAWVKTDATDYAPGTPVNITGGGWRPGETVTLHFQESPYYDSHPALTAVADSNGNISNSQFAPDSHDLNIRFYLTATGATSNSLAQTTFTDAISPKSLTLGTQTPSPVTPGESASYSVLAIFNGSGGTCHVDLSVFTDTGETGLPAQATPSFDPGSIQPNSPNATLTIGTTGVSPGSYTFSVQGIPETDCSNGSKTVTATATLVVSGSAPAITSGNSTTFTAGSSGNFTVTTTGSPIPSLSESGALPSAVTFVDNHNGTATLSGNATVAGNYPITITAHNGVGTDATQNFTLTVSPGALAKIDLSPSTATITAGGSQSYTATGYDQGNNPIGDVTAATTFTISNGTCSANSCGSTVAGMQTVTGKDGAISGTATLTVNSGVPTHLALSPATSTISAGSSQTYTAQGLDIYGNSAGDVTNSTTFSITGSGSCTGASCSSTAAGPYTVTGTYANSAQGTASLTVTAGSFTQLQILAPGETAAPGTASGYSGTPSVEYVNGAFNLTVNAVDPYFNVLSITDTVAISSNDSKAILPSNAALVAGTGTFSVTPETVSNPATTTFTATDTTTNTIAPATTPAIEVITAYTAAITPAMAATGQATTYTLTINNGTAKDASNLASATIAIPTADRGSITGVSVNAMQPGGSAANWTYDASQLPNTIRFSANTAKDAVAPGGTISVTFTATSSAALTSAPVQEMWNTVAFTDSQWTSALPLASVEPTVGIGVGPSFTNTLSATFTYGSAGTYTVTTNGVPTNTLSESGAPSGVTFTDNGNDTATIAIAGTATAAGTYPFTITASNGYGSDITKTFTLTVNKADATITVTPYHVTYDTTAHIATGKATGVGSADLSADLNLTSTSHTNAGTYSSDTWTFTDPGGNYNSTSGVITDEIDQATASITVIPYHVTYTGGPHSAMGTATGAGGVNLIGDLNLTNTTHTNAGTYSSDFWTFTDLTGNYKNVPTTTITDQIDRANATISVAAYSIVYDGNAHVATGSATGVLGELLAGLNLGGTTHIDAGNYSDSWTFTDSTGNYTNATGMVSDVIAKATPVFSNLTPSQTIPYGEATIGAGGNLAAASAAPPNSESVTVSISGTPVSQIASLSGGAFSASLNTSTIPASSSPYTVSYSFAGDANFNPASDSSTTLTVNPATTATTVNSATSPSILGQAVTFTAAVADTSSGDTAVPTGVVFFYDGTTLIGSAQVDASGKAAFTTALLSSAASPHSVNASFLGNADFSPSTSSAAAAQAVNPRSSSTRASVNPSNVIVGQTSTVTLTVTDTATTGPSGTPGVFAAATKGLNTPRTGQAAALLPNGMVLIVGGQNANGDVLSSGEIYDPTTGTFTNTANSLQTGVTGATATLLSDGTVLIAGGSTDGTSNGATSAAEIYDPVALTFKQLSGGLATARANAMATLLRSGKVLIAGGENGSGSLADMELYDPSTQTFSAIGDTLSVAREGATATMLYSGQILFAGGNGTSSAEIYDPAAHTSTLLPNSMTVDRTNHTAALLPDGNVLIAGGTSSGDAVATAELFNPAAETFTAAASNLTTPRSGLTATMLDSALVLVIGGSNSGNAALSPAELYRPSFDPLGTVAASSSDNADVIGSSPCTLVLTGSGMSTCQITDVPVEVGTNPHTLTAKYAPAADQVHTASDNSSQSDGKDQLTVQPAPTSTTVSSSQNPSTFGQSVSFTATVSNTAGAGVSTATPTGSVQFYLDGNAFGSPVALSGAGASATATSEAIATLAVSGSPHTVKAVFSNADGNFVSGNGSIAQTITAAPTSLMVTSSQNPSTFGQSVSFTATVSDTAGAGVSTATPTGSVQFYLDGNAFGSPIVLSGTGVSATVTSGAISSLTASGSPHKVTAQYTNSDGNFVNSSGSLTPGQTVNPAATTTTVISNPNPSTYGQTVTFTAFVTNTAVGSPAVPTGSVIFKIDGGTSVAGTLEVCPSAVPANRLCATFSTSALIVNGSPHMVSASYTNSDGNFVSGGGTLVNGQTVAPAPLMITASSSAMIYGGPTPPITASYSGFVNNESFTNLSTQPTCGTTAASSSPVGTYASACSGAVDPNYTFNYVPGLVTVNPATTALTVTSSTNGASIYMQPVTFTATVAPQFTGVPSGTVAFYDAGSDATCVNPGSAQIGISQPLSAVPGSDSASATTALLSGTSHTILACYSGDTNFLSSSGAVNQTVTPAPVVTVTPTTMSFTGQNVGTTSSPMNVTLTNIGDAPLLISGVNIVNSTVAGEFKIQTNGCGNTLGYPGQSGNPATSCTIAVTFMPSDTGEASATLQISDNNNDDSTSQQDVILTGGGLSTISSLGSLYNDAVFATGNGCGSIVLSGGSTIDSFNSLNGFSSTHQLGGGNVGTNGNVTLNGSKSAIYGSASVLSLQSGACTKSSVAGLTSNGGAQVTGGMQQLGGAISYPAPSVPNPAPPTTAVNITHSCPSGMTGCTNSGSNAITLASGSYGNVQIGAGTTVSLTTGTYNFNSLTITGKGVLNVASAPVIINIAGAALNGSSPALDLSGGSIVNPTGIPSNLQFYYGGSRGVNLSGGSQAYATVYAPSAPVNMSGGTDFFGSIIGLSVSDSGGTAIHYDSSLTSVPQGDYVWLTAVINNVNVGGKSLPSNAGQVKLYLTNSTVSFAAMEAQCSSAGETYKTGTCTLSVPNSVVTLNSASATTPKTSYDLTNNRWVTSVPPSDVTGNTFVAGIAIPVPAGGFPSGIQNVSWATAFSTDTPNVTFQWQWSAGVYNTPFNSCYAYQNTNSSNPCYNSTSNGNLLGVNPEDGSANINKTDPAGTPETYKKNEVIGFFSAPAGVAAAAAEMSVAPSNYAFAVPQAQGTPSPVKQVSTLTNNDGVTHTINGFSVLGANAADFALQSGGSNSCTAVASLAAGASCNLYVVFTPSSGGTKSARIVANDDANNTPQSVYLTGTAQ